MQKIDPLSSEQLFSFLAYFFAIFVMFAQFLSSNVMQVDEGMKNSRVL